MLNKLVSFIRRYELLQSGDKVICGVSGGADSVALLFAMYLLREKLGISVSAAHFNHRLRGAESDRDEAFVRTFCAQYDIPLLVGSGDVVPGKKGLEAAARDARYGYFRTLDGKIATAHTADDNAETVLMHLVRGSGLKGLGGIAPVNGQIIRPMLEITRQEVLAFLQEYHLQYVSDSTNASDRFLRNRLRNRVMPLLKQENPRLAESMSATALRLRQDEAFLESAIPKSGLPKISDLRQMAPAIRSRVIGAFLEENGVPEPEAQHIALTEKLIFSKMPSAKADLPGGVTIARNYEKLERLVVSEGFIPQELCCPGETVIPELNIKIVCIPAQTLVSQPDCFTVTPVGKLVVRPRREGDCICLSGGTKSLKKLFIDKKIPAAQRQNIPVLEDDLGVVGVAGIGADRQRLCAALPGITIRFIPCTER